VSVSVAAETCLSCRCMAMTASFCTTIASFRRHVTLKQATIAILQYYENIPCRHLFAVCLSNVGALTFRNPMGLHGL
jgi:hypothetical protein